MTLPERSAAPFITFYSFKGGVGRSMALINVAGIIAARGFRVLVIDMDLEAPGLSFLANPGEREIPEARRQLGFVDFLLDAVEAKAEADLFKRPPAEVVARYSAPYELPEGFSRNPEGGLRIMPAGWLDADYSRRLERLDLPGLYRAGTGLPLLQAFKQVIRDSEMFDYVFIDSRTGFSDESGICTRDLADCLIVVSGLNKQNVEGTTRLLRTLRRSADKPERLEIVLSPIPNGEDALVDERVAKAQAAFSEAWGAELQTDLHIPYHPQLALTEEPHIFRRRTGYLFDAYHKIERRLRELLGHTPEDWLDQALEAYNAQEYDAALEFAKLTDRLADTREWADHFAFTAGLHHSGADAVYDFIIPKVSSRVRGAVAGWIGHVVREMDWETESEAVNTLCIRALDANPNDVDMLEAFARFSWLIHGDQETAESLFVRALAQAPDLPVSLAHYGCFCICAGRVNEGLVLVERALGQIPSTWGGIAAECWMYIYCCGTPERRDVALAELKGLIEASVSTGDWDFSCVIRQAEAGGHPHKQWLSELADVLAHRQPSAALAGWEAWRETAAVPFVSPPRTFPPLVPGRRKTPVD